MSSYHAPVTPHTTANQAVAQNQQPLDQMENEGQRKEIYTYDAPWTVQSMAWCNRLDPSSRFRLAIGSFVEEYSNCVQIIKKRNVAASGGITGNTLQQDTPPLYTACQFDHPYPCTKLLWNPDSYHGSKDLVATSGDYLRLWNLMDDGTGNGTMNAKKEIMLDNNKRSEFCAPLTSFDWNHVDASMLGTASIDTTCIIWDLNTQTAKTQLIAHDREVFDIAFGEGKDIFATVGADGSLRMFDLRSLDHSSIMYESPNLVPLLRLEWNKKDSNVIATFTVDSKRAIILDIRMPSTPVAQLGGHTASINASAWAPHSPCHICTAGDDNQALIWDLAQMHTMPVEDPILAYQADGEINNLQWSTTQPDWISIAYKDKVQILRV